MPLTGRWRIVEMDMWDRDAIDLVEPGGGLKRSVHQLLLLAPFQAPLPEF